MEFRNSSSHELASPSINTAKEECLEERPSDWDAEKEKFCIADAAESSEQHDPSILQPSPGPTVTLSNIGNELPAQQHLTAVEGVEANGEAMTNNTVDGSVDGASNRGGTSLEICNGAGHMLATHEPRQRQGLRLETRNDAGHVLATDCPSVSQPKQGPVFILFNIGDELPAQYRLATVEDIETNRKALLQAMPRWEIANLANGSVDGALYGGHIRLQTRNDVGHVLATHVSRGRPGPRGGNDMIIRLISRGL